MLLKTKLLDPDAKLPIYKTRGAVGADVSSIERVDLKSGEFKAIRTGLAVELPEGSEIEIRPRSGLAAKYGVTVLNSPGTIDSDYRGEIKVILINHGPQTFSVDPGDRIAQLVVRTVTNENQTVYTVVEELNETPRGENGLGSTGDS